MDLEESARRVKDFEGASLSDRLWSLEYEFQGLNKQTAAELCQSNSLDANLLAAAFELKKLAGQINVLIHAAGILTALPSILEKEEVVEYLSLGAGSTGRAFDLETNRRVAEFKFINWRGGAESIRQNSLFKDFYELAEADTPRQRYLYLLGLVQPLKFLTGRRSLSSVMSKNATLAADFQKRYGTQFTVVREYYEHRKDRVELVDVTPVVPELAGLSEAF